MAKHAHQGEYPGLYPDINPFNTGFLKVSDIHTLYYEQSGCTDGKPVVVLHGGPGSGSSSKDRRFFDPSVYRIIQFDQRGSGKSLPLAELRDNTTWHLVEDIETLREHLGIEKWVVFGGSWGSTLSLAYAETHPEKVKALILRGIYLIRRSDNEWFNEGKGANMVFPEYFEEYRDYIPETERCSLMNAYYRRLTSEDENTRVEAARKWNKYEMATSALYIDEEKLSKADREEAWNLQHARTECHYFIHGGFLKKDSQLLDDVEKIRHIPATIVQGRYDVVCGVEAAWQLHKRWPEAEFYIVPDSGHTVMDPGTRSKVLEATEKYKTL